jgi:2-polyprenyl-3-methyl-5-hydroxy-6-metoxy-1,4-benzoquinol methylase
MHAPNERKTAMECPNCAGREFADFRFALSRCSACSLIVDEQAIERSRAESSQEEWFAIPEAARSLWVRRFEVWNNERTIARVRRYVNPPARVLEVGIGSGSLLQAMRGAGFDVHGCDSSAAVGRYVRETAGVPVFVGRLADMPPSGAFDVVVMNHVLEHTSGPIAFLTDARRHAKPGALFHLAVPNVASWNARMPGWTSYEPYHLIYFSPKTLRDAVARAGLECVELSTFEPFSGWFLALLRTALQRGERNSNRRETRDRDRSKRGIEHLYRVAMLASGAASYPLRRLQSRLGKGEEVVMLATNGPLR